MLSAGEEKLQGQSKKNSKNNTTSNEQEQNHQVPMEEIPSGTKKRNHQHE